MLVFFFSALAIKAVGKAAYVVIEDVRAQFKEHPGIMQGTEKPDYGRTVDIVTRGALRQMIAPGLVAVGMPIVVGLIFKQFGVGAEAVAALLMVGTIAGILMAHVPEQRRRRLGQRQEVHRDRRLRRQGLRRRTRPRSSATPSAIRSRTPPARRCTC